MTPADHLLHYKLNKSNNHFLILRFTTKLHKLSMKDGARAVSTIMDLLVLLVFFFLMRLDTSFSTTLLLVRDIVDLFCLYCIYNIDSCGLVLCVRRETRVEMNERGVCGSTH